MKWEYKRIPSTEEEMEQLERLGFEQYFLPMGLEGWEIIYVGSIVGYNFYYLKRPLP